MKKSAAFIVLTVLAAISVLSCQIGLGSAVDVEAPTLDFSNPPIDAKIRGKFNIDGTYSDDGIVAEVKAKLEDTDGKGLNFEYKGTLNKTDGTWSIEIDPKAEDKPIPDGSYQATVTMKDLGGHSSSQTRTFTIDNTPPVIVLQRPAAKTSDSAPDSYGQTFTITGQAADDSDISLIELLIYADPERKELLNTISLNNVPPTISLDAAKFVEGTDNDYSKIYGSTSKQGTKELYCSIRAYDGTKFYPAEGNQSTDDLKGNCTTHYYLYEEISSSVLSSYKITEVYQMASGKYATATAEKTAADIIGEVSEALSKKKIEVGYFSLNPANNPYFTVSGRDSLKKDGNDFTGTDCEVSNGTTLVIEVSTGLDSIPLDVESLKVYAVQCDSDGNAVEGAERVYPTCPAPTKSGSSYKFYPVFQATDGFVYKANYILGVEGNDQSKNEVIGSGNGYGFKFVTSGAAPDLDLSAPSQSADNYVKKGDSVTVQGSVKVEEGLATLYVYLDNVLIAEDGPTTSPHTIYKSPVNGGTSTYEYVLPASAFNQGASKKYNIKVIADQGRSSTETTSVIYDVDAPILKNYAATPVVNTDTLNGITVFTGYIEDAKSGLNSSSVTYTVQKSDDGGATWNDIEETVGGNTVTHYKDQPLANPEDFRLSIDTTLINSNLNKGDINLMRLTIRAKDSAGNETSDASGSQFVKTYKVEQFTDHPVITSADGAFNKELTYSQLRSKIATQTTTDANLFTKGSTLAVKITDDDGLKNKETDALGNTISGVMITCTPYSYVEVPDPQNPPATKWVEQAGAQVVTEPMLISGEPTNTTLTYTLPDTSGAYQIHIQAYDKNFGTPNQLTNSQSGETFFVQVTGAAPDATLTITPEYITTNAAAGLDATYKKQDLSAKVKIKDGTGPFKVTGGNWTNEPFTNVNDEKTDTVTPAAGSGSGSLKYTVTDNYGTKKEIEENYKVDNTKPTVTVTTTAPTPADTQNASFTYTGTAADNDESGVARIDVSFRADHTDTVSASGTSSWNYTAVFSELEKTGTGKSELKEGVNKFYVRAVDNVGNIGNWEEQNFVYDKAAPTITSVKVTQDGETEKALISSESENNVSFDVSKKYKLSVSAADSNGITKIEVYQTKTGDVNGRKLIDTKTFSNVSSANWDVTNLPRNPSAVSNHLLATGSFEYEIIVYDASDAKGASPKTVTRNVTGTVDTAAPVVTLTSPSSDGDILSGNSYTFGGKVKDVGSVGVSKVYYAITASQTAPIEVVTDTTKWKDVSIDTIGTTEVSWQVTKTLGTGTSDATKDLSEGEYYVHVKAADKAGNVTATAITKHFFVDQAAPELSSIKKDSQTGDELKESEVFNYKPGTNLVLSGKVKESHGLKSIKVTVEGLTPVTVSSLPAASTSAVEWNCTITGIPANELKKVTIEAIDKADNKTTKNFNIYADNQVPELSITSPVEDYSAANNGDDTLSWTEVGDGSYKFRASVIDTGSGIPDNKYKYRYTQTELTIPSGQTLEKVIADSITADSSKWSEGTKQIFTDNKTLTAGTTAVSGKLNEGKWFLYIYAKDKVGNEKALKRVFYVDKAAPVVTTKLDGTALATTETKTKTANTYLITFSIAETNGLDATTPCSVTVKKDNNTTLVRGTDYKIYTGAALSLTEFAGNDFAVNTDYTIKLESTATDGLYSYIIDTKDVCGKTGSVTRNVRLDTAGPVLTFESPSFSKLNPADAYETSAWQTSSKINVIGTATDVSGIEAVYYAYKPASEPVLPSAADAMTESKWTADGWTKLEGTSNWNISETDANDGLNLELFVAAVDKCGNLSSKYKKIIRKDSTRPVLEETSVKTTGAKINASTNPAQVVLSGTMSDASSGLKTISVTNGLQTWSVSDLSADYTTGGWTWLPVTGAAGHKDEWKLEIPIGSGTGKLPDGNHLLSIDVQDNAGNIYSVQRSVTVDTKIPSTGSMTITTTGKTIGSNTWYNTSLIGIKVADVEDLKLNGYASGISAVEYSTNASGIDDDSATWIPLTKGTEAADALNGNVLKADWTSASVNCTVQGKNIIIVRVKDAAGNKAAELRKEVYIDTVAPAVPTNYWVDGINKVTGSKLINTRDTVTVNIVVEDSGDTDKASGIGQITYNNKTTSKVTGTTSYTPSGAAAAVEVYSLVIAKTDLPASDGAALVVIEDNVGNKYNWQPFAFSVDTVAPEVEIKTPSNAGTNAAGKVLVNKTINFNGTASDGRSLSMIDICYYINEDTPAGPSPAFTGKTWTRLERVTSNPAVWSYSLDTTSSGPLGTVPDGTEVILCVIATDEAGNRNLDTTAAGVVTDNTTAVTNAGGTETGRIPSVAPASINNKAVNTYSIVVDQDTDRPVITFTNLTLGDSLTSTVYIPFENNVIYGNISDDDGLSTTAGDIQYKAGEAAWKNLTVTNGSFRITGLSEGSTSVLFKVKDASGTSFTTNAVSSPKLSDGTNTYGNISELKLKVDTVAPYVESSVQYTREIPVGGTPVWSTGIANAVFGGTQNKLYLNQFAYDANGIQGAAVLIPIDSDDLGVVTTNISGYGWTSLDGSTTVYTNTNTLVANTTKYYSDVSCKVETGKITGVAAGNDSITIGANTYLKSYYRYAWDKVSGSTHSGVYTYEEWRSPEIDVTGMATGSRTVIVEVSDGIRATRSTLPLAIDNTAPVVSLSQPSATQYSSGNITAYGTIDSATNMFYALSLDNSTTPGADDTHKGSTITTWNGLNVTTEAATSGTASYEPYYQPVNGFGIQWFVYFDGGSTTALASHDVSFKQFLIDSGVTTAVNIQNKSFTDIVNAYLWIKAVDVAGNTTVEKYPVLIDPQGDAPALTIDYPEEDGTTLGGAVSLRGTATDTVGTNIGIDNVWVQIISAKENGYTSSNATQTHTTGGFKFTDTVTTSVVNAETTYTHTYALTSFAPTMKDVKQWYDNGYEVWSGITGTPVKLASSPTASASSGADYYIKATFSGSAWTLKINEKSEFDPATGKINPVAYRVCAVDKDKTISKAQIGFSVFDSDLPVISNVYLRQYSDNTNGTGTVTASREYSDDMWVKGTWWLCGEAKDTQGLNSLKVAGNSINTISKTPNATETFKYKLESGTGVGKLSIEIEAEDNATPKKHSSVKECVINYDNVEPSLVTSGSAFNISSIIQNSNGFHSFGSQVVEAPVGTSAQSGFKYLAFWYERNISGGKHVVYDVMRAKANSEVAWSDVTSDSGLMWKTKTVTRSAAALGTLTLSAADANIHVGGLCKIGGSIYMISSVSGTTIGIDGQPEMPSGATTQTAYFAIANVVNNTIEAGTGTKSTVDGKYGYFDSVSNDDGDHMVESVQKSGTTWTWEANINSQNIPDGAVTLHYVAFDAAGNYKEETANANVSNNAPRLASLRVWSDFNENDTMDEGEYETYYYNGKERKISGAYVERATKVTDTLVVSGNKKDYTDGGSAFMTVKAATVFKPEVVGGNGALYYSYKAGNASGLASATPTIGASSLGTGQDDGIDEEVDANGYYKADDNEMGYISGQELTISDLTAAKLDALGNSTSIANPTWFEYTIYDSTEGCDATWNTATLSTANRLSATFRIALNIQYQDSAKPKAWIRPFYWKKTGKPDSGTDLYNSLEWDSTGKTPQGHIELEDDLTTEITTALGSEPKVSGIIKVEGYAFDDIKLKELSVKFAGHSKLNTAQVASTYTGTWSTTAYNATNGWGFTANDVYCNGNGHLVHWVLTVDTAKQANVADSDKAFEIIAKDARGNSGSGLTSDASTTQTALTTYLWGTVKSEVNAGSTYFTDPCCYTTVNNSTGDNTVVYKASTSMTPYYKVDIVPYITSIQTTNRAKSGLKDNNIRSASGKYSIIKGTEANFITVNGFNLNPTNVRIVSSSDVTGTITRASGNPVTFGTVFSDYTSVGLKNDGSKSGYLELFVNGIRTLNNINNNDSKGSFVLTGGTKQAPVATVYDYENMPNREADYNITKNVQLTDDRYIRFFDMKKTGTKNGYYPVMIMDGDNPVFSYVDANGCTDGTCTYIPQCFQPQRRKFNGSSAGVISTEYLCGGIAWDQMAMARDSVGRYYNVSVYNQNGGSMGFYYDKYASLYNNEKAGNYYGNDSTRYNNVAWQMGTGYYGYNGNWSRHDENNALTLDGINYTASMVDRYQNIKLLVEGDSTTTAGAAVYQGYYDDYSGEILFRQFKIGQQSSNCTIKMYSENGYNQYTNLTENKDETKAAQGRIQVTGSGSKYYDFGIVTDNGKKYAVYVYYDYSEGKLILKYSSELNGKPTQNITWTKSSISLPDYVGQYVSMTVSGTSLHIAAFDASDSDLVYIYVPSYKGTNYTKIIVDAAGSVGNWTQIKLNSSNQPVIAYYNATETGGHDAIKLAIANDVVGSVTAGVDSTTNYTSTGWEYMTVPSIDPAQGGSQKFQNVCLDFDSAGCPVVGYLGTNLEFGKALDE